MIDSERVVKGLEWILEDDRFGFGIDWEAGEPRDDYEKAGKIITDTIALLKEQEEKIYSAKEIAMDESTNAAWRKDFEAWKVLDRIVQKLS